MESEYPKLQRTERDEDRCTYVYPVVNDYPYDGIYPSRAGQRCFGKKVPGEELCHYCINSRIPLERLMVERANRRHLDIRDYERKMTAAGKPLG